MSAIAAVKLSGILDHSLARLTTSATVGVDHTMSPEGFIQPGIVKWVDRTAGGTNPLGVAIGYPALTLSVRSPTKVSRVYKIIVKLLIPTLEQTGTNTSTGILPPPTKAYDCAFIGEFLIPERSTLLERQRLFSAAASLFVRTINASDASPTDSTGSPLEAAVTTFETVF